MKTLRLILGDQLNYKHSWYKTVDPDATYLIMEMKQETDYVLHHAQKVLGFFAAMYNFAAYLRKNGHNVIHLRINDAVNTQKLSDNLLYFIKKNKIEKFEYLLPDEYRLDLELENFCSDLEIQFTKFDTEHFFTERFELKEFFSGKKTYLMESFYRYMRKKHHVLMQGDQPEGGQWNFDKSNRKALKGHEHIPAPLEFHHDYTSIFNEIQQAAIKTFGSFHEKEFPWPTTRKEALRALNFFIVHMLPDFGNYQDSMHTHFRYLFHSRISFAMNIKMISPREVVEQVELAWRNNPEQIGLNSVEGYIRQILGWREYMRGMYWSQMPEFKQLNYFSHTEKLPEWFWTGETKMNCLKQSIGQSLDLAYAHHIQRLMVIGNFALLSGIHPDEVDQWYLGVYIDAIEWVEITNTRGMSQFADGGLIGTKPYISGAPYISKMSNYCKTCFYDQTKKTGFRACPFNSLYWNFLDRHEDKLGNNHRMMMMYNVWNKTSAAEKEKILLQANEYLNSLNSL